jgi:CRP/FNR family transcriptional regulator, transcriptional activator FtrB
LVTEMREADRRTIESLPYFQGLSAQELDWLLEGSLVQSFAAETILIEQGERPEFLHVVLGGRVGLLGEGADGRETVVEFMETGESFILAAVLTDAPYLMSARVLTDARILLLSAARLRERVAADPALAVKMLASLARNFRMLVRQVKDLKLRTTHQRLGCYLLALADGQGGGPVDVELPVDKRLIAARLGMTPESLSRAFATLRPLGVMTSGQHVVIADVETLVRHCLPDSALLYD